MNFGISDKTRISHQPGKKGITWILMCAMYYVACMGNVYVINMMWLYVSTCALCAGKG